MTHHPQDLLKELGVLLGAILLFLALSYGFVPQVLDGKVVNQSDISGYLGMSHEMNEWNAAHLDDPTYWTDAMFGGMPTTSFSADRRGDWTQPLYDFLLTGKRPATYLFITLLGAFLLLIALGVHWGLALGGAVAVAFCAYNPQIIQVGHNTKMQAIAFLPWVLAALVLTYRQALADNGRRSGWLTVSGAALFGLTVSFQVKANHQQITYYLALVILLYAIGMLIHVLRNRRDALRRFFLASGLLLVLGGLGIAANANKLLPLYRYTQYTMRGGSELEGNGGASSGLDLGYATAWSYGWNELPNLLIPDFNGGSSAGAVDPKRSETVRILRRAGQANVRETAKALPMYWGPQPFTAGPMYMGAITLFLFVLGLCLYRGPDRGWLIAATVLAVLMGVGSHFMAFTRLCFVVLPLYSKFRTVSMALVVLQFTLPVLGFLVLDSLLRGGYDRAKARRGLFIAYAVTGGFCLLCWLFPGIAGSFRSPADANYPDLLTDAFAADRRMLLRQDARTSFLFTTGAFGVLLWALGGQLPRRRAIAGAAVCLLLAVNLLGVARRYLNADHFVTPKDFAAQFDQRPVDRAILADPDPGYRVLDLTVNIFNDSHPSYWHKNIGGYSPAKLQRYQDLIDRYLTPEYYALHGKLRGIGTVEELEADFPDTPLLNALNCKYLILGADFAPVRNPNALGPAWIVRDFVPADTPDEELARIGEVDLATTAVIGADFPEAREAAAAAIAGPAAAEDRIELVSYAPNALTYRYQAAADRVAVFSEVYYPDGWSATLDGTAPVGLFRTDWLLRGAVLPAGEHTLTLRFSPASYATGRRVSRAASLLLVLLTLLALTGAALPSLRKEGSAAPRNSSGK